MAAARVRGAAAGGLRPSSIRELAVPDGRGTAADGRASARTRTLAGVGPRSPTCTSSPTASCRGTPNVVVDGSPTAGTVLCLSHWPGIGSPPEFAADLSAEMAFAYLDAFDRHPGAAAGVEQPLRPGRAGGGVRAGRRREALARRDLLVEVARAGDFAVTSSREAARVSMVLSAYADPGAARSGVCPTTTTS